MRRVAIAALTLSVTLLAGVPAFAAPKAKIAVPAAAKARPASEPVDLPPPDFQAWAKDAAARSVSLLQASSATFSAKRKCIACHHQPLTGMAVELARGGGVKVDEAQAGKQESELKAQLAQFAGLLRAARADKKAEQQIDFFMVDPAQTGGYLTAQMKAAGYPRDEAAANLAHYLGKKQLPDGRWTYLGARPPQTSSDFTSTALAIQGIRGFGAPEDAAELDGRIRKAREWLAASRAKTNEDRTFRLLALKWAGADAEAVRKAAAELLEAQQDDGGWSQLDGKATDAYATAQALVALHQGGGLPVADPAYLRGFFYLLARQGRDGSWRVATRSMAVQSYFETGFPHGKDQFISAAATAWAAMAIIPALDALPAPPAPPAKTAAAR